MEASPLQASEEVLPTQVEGLQEQLSFQEELSKGTTLKMEQPAEGSVVESSPNLCRLCVILILANYGLDAGLV